MTLASSRSPSTWRPQPNETNKQKKRAQKKWIFSKEEGQAMQIVQKSCKKTCLRFRSLFFKHASKRLGPQVLSVPFLPLNRPQYAQKAGWCRRQHDWPTGLGQRQPPQPLAPAAPDLALPSRPCPPATHTHAHTHTHKNEKQKEMTKLG